MVLDLVGSVVDDEFNWGSPSRYLGRIVFEWIDREVVATLPGQLFPWIYLCEAGYAYIWGGLHGEWCEGLENYLKN